LTTSATPSPLYYSRYHRHLHSFPTRRSSDLNPPFHRHHTVDAEMAVALFAQAGRALSSQGELWVVANQHLGHEMRLRRYFQQVTRQARHPKFVLLRATGSKFSKRHKK